jgi:hypothetical protein
MRWWRQLAHFRGREIATAGDGFLALFDNTWSDSEADETPYADSGTGNCGKGNNFVVPACP